MTGAHDMVLQMLNNWSCACRRRNQRALLMGLRRSNQRRKRRRWAWFGS